jgi:hypothetical protein
MQRGARQVAARTSAEGAPLERKAKPVKTSAKPDL